MSKPKKTKLSKLNLRIVRANGHRSEIDADLGERGVALSELFVAYLSGGEDAVPGLTAVLDAFITSRAPAPAPEAT